MASLSSSTGIAIISHKDGGVKLENNVKAKPYNYVLSLSYPGKRMDRRTRQGGRVKRAGQIGQKSMGVWGRGRERGRDRRSLLDTQRSGPYKKPLTFHKEGIIPRR